MTDYSKYPHKNRELDKSYEAIVQDMRDLYKGQISDQEAHEAARNLIGFFQTLLAMRKDRLAREAQEK